MSLCILGALLVTHALGVGLDFAAAIGWSLQLDYGEGIVWQQALLIDTPRAYATSPGLPFVVFHYPPLYHFAVRAMVWLVPDWLSAGRVVSIASTAGLALVVAGLVLVGSTAPGSQRRQATMLCACLTGLLVLCVPAIRTWGMVMRVDMLALMLSMAGLLAAARWPDRLGALICALLLCTAAVFTKQSQLPCGVAVAIVAAWRAPRRAGVAVLVAGSIGLAALGVMQYRTDGGFLLHVLSYNVNRFALAQGWAVLQSQRASCALMALIIGAFVIVMRGAWSSARLDRTSACRAMVLLQFVLATAMLPSAFKLGSNMNYLLEWLASGCVLLGFVLSDSFGATQAGALRFALLAIAVTVTPWRVLPDHPPEDDLRATAELLQRIAAAELPVASDDMSLLMRAGKPVVYEPAIATELASVGRWDETPLVRMIAARKFAFMITADDETGGGLHRTDGVAVAMRSAYPQIEPAGAGLFLRRPTP